MGWSFAVVLDLASRLEVEQVVVGIPRQASSKQQVPWPEVTLPAQVGFFLEEWVKRVLVQEQHSIHFYKDSLISLVND